MKVTEKALKIKEEQDSAYNIEAVYLSGTALRTSALLLNSAKRNQLQKVEAFDAGHGD